MAYGEKKRAERLRAMKAGKLPVREAMRNHDWDSLIAKAEEHLKDAKGAERKLPPLWQIAKKCGLQQDYLGYYSLFSEATHSGHIELGGYMKLNAEGTGVGTLLYGLEDGDWVDWVAREGAGFLIDCMELSAHIFRIRTTRNFEQLFKPLLRKGDDITQRFREVFIPGHLEKGPVWREYRRIAGKSLQGKSGAPRGSSLPLLEVTSPATWRR